MYFHVNIRIGSSTVSLTYMMIYEESFIDKGRSGKLYYLLAVVNIIYHFVENS